MRVRQSPDILLHTPVPGTVLDSAGAGAREVWPVLGAFSVGQQPHLRACGCGEHGEELGFLSGSRWRVGSSVRNIQEGGQPFFLPGPRLPRLPRRGALSQCSCYSEPAQPFPSGPGTLLRDWPAVHTLAAVGRHLSQTSRRGFLHRADLPLCSALLGGAAQLLGEPALCPPGGREVPQGCETHLTAALASAEIGAPEESPCIDKWGQIG